MIFKPGTGGSSGSSGLSLIYFAQSQFNQVDLEKPGKLAIVTCNVLNNSGAVMVTPGNSQHFGQLSSKNNTVSFSEDGMSIDLPDATTMTVAVFG